MSTAATDPASAMAMTPQLSVDYVHGADPHALLGEDTLAVLGFGSGVADHDDPRFLRVPLRPHGTAPMELWRGSAPVRRGRDDGLAWSSDGALAFGAIEVDEAEHGLERAAEIACRRMLEHVRDSDTPHLLRVWNYLAGITHGEGDTERYRRFCVGRARGLGDFDTGQLPAATAIGRSDESRVLQVYWLAARQPGTPVENPRQVSAYHYPRQYGPQAPSFARAMLPPAGSHMPLLLSGTAAVVGHASRHEADLLAQIDETFRNFDALIGNARQQRPGLPPAFGSGSRLKVYVRDAADLPVVADALQQRLGHAVPHLILHAAICRRELAIEIDGVHG